MYNSDIRRAERLRINAQRTAAAYHRALQASAQSELALTQALAAISRARLSSATIATIKQRTSTQQEHPIPGPIIPNT